MTNPYGNLQSDKSQRLALEALLDGTSPSMALKQDATTAAGWAGTGSVARSVEDELRDLGVPNTRWGTDTAALASAFSASDEVVVPAGSYALSSLTVPAGKTLVLRRGAEIQVSSGGTVSISGRVRAPDVGFGQPGNMGNIGDSRMGGSSWLYPGTSTKNINAILTWIELLSKGALRYSLNHIASVGGSKTSALDGQLTAMFTIGYTPRYCVILSGTNDDSGMSADVQFLNLFNAWLRLLARGITPIHIADLPRVVANYTANLTRRNRQVTDRLSRLAYRMGVIFVDPTHLLLDTTNANGDRLASLYASGSDEVHQAPVANKLIAQMVVDLFNKTNASPAIGFGAPPSSASVYDATYNPFGNQWADPLFLGSASAAGTGMTGNGPPGHAPSRNAGSSTGAGSLVSRSDGTPGKWWQVSVGSTTSDYCEYITNDNYVAVVGNWIEFSADFDCDSLVGTATPCLQLDMASATQGTTAYKAGSNSSTGALIGASPSSYSGRICAGPIQIPAGTTAVRTRLRAEFPAGSSGNIRLGNPCLRFVDGPLG